MQVWPKLCTKWLLLIVTRHSARCPARANARAHAMHARHAHKQSTKRWTQFKLAERQSQSTGIARPVQLVARANIRARRRRTLAARAARALSCRQLTAAPWEACTSHAQRTFRMCWKQGEVDNRQDLFCQ